MTKTLKQFIVENAPEQVTEERMPERDVMAHKIDAETWQNNLIGADEVKRHAGGEFTFYRSFYFKHGNTSQKHADVISAQLDKLGIKHTVVGHDERYGTPFRGGAPVTKQDHFSVRVKIHPGQAARIGEDGGIQRHVEEQQVTEMDDARERVLATKAGKGSPLEFQQRLIKHDARRIRAESVTESEKPFVKVVLDEPRGTSYTVVASTFDHPLGKVGTKLTDVGMDKLVMMHHNDEIHLENASDKGSGPGSKPGYFGRKSFRT